MTANGIQPLKKSCYWDQSELE